MLFKLTIENVKTYYVKAIDDFLMIDMEYSELYYVIIF